MKLKDAESAHIRESSASRSEKRSAASCGRAGAEGRDYSCRGSCGGYNRLDLPADHGLTIFTYAAEPGSRSEEALNLLGSWAATADPAESAHAADQGRARHAVGLKARGPD